VSIIKKSTLQVSKFGQSNVGPILVLLHGWGSSSKIWQSCVNELSKKWCIYCVDLPGHGENHAFEWNESVDQLLVKLAEVLPEKCSIAGWSLGGLLAQKYLERFPQRVQSLMLIASTPKFIASADWPHAMPEKTFKNFLNQFETKPKATIKQFNALQTLHGASAKKVLSSLQKALESNKDSDENNKFPEKIRWGLDWLQEMDLRNVCLPESVPVIMFQGEKDQVSSLQAAEDTAASRSQLSLYRVADAGHVPFISHQEQFIERVDEMLTNTDRHNEAKNPHAE